MFSNPPHVQCALWLPVVLEFATDMLQEPAASIFFVEE
jgi:hypothetical protein